MNFPQRLGYSSTTTEFCSFFNPPHKSPQASPRSGEHRDIRIQSQTNPDPFRGIRCSICDCSSRALAGETTGGDCDHDGDGSAYSTTATLCGALGIPSPSPHSRYSPKSPASDGPSKFGTAEQQHRSFEGNGAASLISTKATRCTPESIRGGFSEPDSADAKDITVFVWDLDETLIIFQTLLSGQYAELFDGLKDSHKATLLGRRWERLILEVCDDYFNYKQVEDYNYPHLESLQDYDDGIDLQHYSFDDEDLVQPFDADNLRKLSYRHRFAKNLYEKGLECLLTLEQNREWQDLYLATDAFTDQWLTTGRQKLEEFQRANAKVLQNKCQVTSTLADANSESVETSCMPTLPHMYNFLVTSGTLIPSLVKCLLFKLDLHFPHSNIFSSREVGKLQCFQWICDRNASAMPRFCVLGDGVDEDEAARVLGWPFVKISTDPDSLHHLPALSYDAVEQCVKAV